MHEYLETLLILQTPVFKALYTLLPWQTCSLRHHFDFSGKHPPYATLNVQRLLVHITTTVYMVRYSFIQLSGLEQCRLKKLAQGFNTVVQVSNPGSRSRESDVLPLSHCALQISHHIRYVMRSLAAVGDCFNG